MRPSFPSRRAAVRFCFLFCSVVSFLLTLAGPAFSWTEELFDAVKAYEKGQASAYQEGLILKHNSEINQMRIKGKISDASYQRSQAYYNQVTAETATAAASRQGAVLEKQRSASAKPAAAGTDTDFILKKVESADQVGKIRGDFNEDFSEIIRKKGVDPGGIDYAKKNDVDFMADPRGISPAEFEKIAQLNNDAYKRPGAASFEAKARQGLPQSHDDTIAYKEEVADFQRKKARQIQERRQELVNHRKHYPDPTTEPHDAFVRRMELESDLQRLQAQRSKYHQRSQYATLELAKQAGDTMEWDPASHQSRKVSMAEIIKGAQSDLPGRGKQRAPAENVSQRQREIDSATAHSVSDHLKYQDTLNEVRILGQMAQRYPDRVPEFQQRIIKMSEGLAPSQQGELLARLHDTGAPARLVSGVTGEMQKTPGRQESPGFSEAMPSSRLQKAGKVAGWVGDLMSISRELEKAAQGQHLFFNLAKTDDEIEKYLKLAAIAGIELAPIPVIDLLERTQHSDLRAQDYINDLARRGITDWQADPAFVMFAVVSTISFDTFNGMFVDPLLQGGEAVMESGRLIRDVSNNFLADFSHAEQQRLLREMKHASHARAQTFDLGGLYGRRGGFAGGPLAGEVEVGETIAFVVRKNEQWTNDYFVRWEHTTPDGKTNVLPPLLMEDGPEAWQRMWSVGADDPEAARRRIVVAPGFLPGPHTVTIRLFERAGGLHIDSREATFTVSGKIGLGVIIAAKDNYLHEKGIPLFTASGGPQAIQTKPGDILAFNTGRIGRWSEIHEVQWLVDGENYKTVAGDHPAADRLRFDSTGMDAGNYRVAVRIIDTSGSTRQILAHQSVDIRLGKLPRKLEPFTIRAALGDYNGPPLPAAVQNGDIIAVQADLKHPEGEPEPAQLFWQVFDAAGKPLAGLAKQEQLHESAGTKNHRFKFQLEEFSDGKYLVALTHLLTSEPDIRTQATHPFQVVQAVRIDRVLVTDNPAHQEHKPLLAPDDEPLLYAYYSLGQGVKKVTVTLTARDAASGRIIETISAERPRPGETMPYRIGLAVPAINVPVGTEVLFEATIVAGDGKQHAARTTFKKESYRLALDLPKTLKSGENRPFAIVVPPGFIVPLKIEVSGRGEGFSVGHAPGQLRGTVSGIAPRGNRTGLLDVRVTDAEGRTATAQARVVISPSSPASEERKPPPHAVSVNISGHWQIRTVSENGNIMDYSLVINGSGNAYSGTLERLGKNHSWPVNVSFNPSTRKVSYKIVLGTKPSFIRLIYEGVVDANGRSASGKFYREGGSGTAWRGDWSASKKGHKATTQSLEKKASGKGPYFVGISQEFEGEHTPNNGYNEVRGTKNRYLLETKSDHDLLNRLLVAGTKTNDG